MQTNLMTRLNGIILSESVTSYEILNMSREKFVSQEEEPQTNSETHRQDIRFIVYS
jgi:hypothetical protein